MTNIKQLILTLVALFAISAGAWADGKVYTSAVDITALQVGDILTEGASINGSGTIYFDLNRVKWNGTLQTEGTIYLYTDDFDSFGAEGVISLSNNTTMSPVDKDNNDGNAWEVTNVHIETNNNYINIQGITYAPAGIEVNGPTIVEGKPQWTFAMPAGNVELQVEYYPGMLVKPTNLVGGTMEIKGLTDTTLPEGFEKDDEGNIYVAKGTKFTVKAVPDEGFHLVAWSDDAENKELEREFTMTDDDFILTTTFSDEYDLAFEALNANTIEDGKATVKVGDTDKTADIQDGKLSGVKYGQTVTLTAATGYKFRKVEAKKGGAAPAPAEGPTLAQTLTTANMTVKVYYIYTDMNNTCEFLSNGDGTYTFQSGTGLVGGNDSKAKALVVENGKLVFKQNFYQPIDKLWDQVGFSVTFDTSENTYSIWKGSNETINATLSKVEVNGTQIALTQQ